MIDISDLSIYYFQIDLILDSHLNEVVMTKEITTFYGKPITICYVYR